MRIVATSLPLLAVLLITAHVARGEIYSAPVTVLAGNSSEALDAAFDFDIVFSQIDRVFVEATISSAVFPAFCTGSYCSVSFLAVNVNGFDDMSGFRTGLALNDEAYPGLYGVFEGVLPVPLLRAGISRPNESFVVTTGQYEYDPWPDFLMTGSGKVRLSQITQVGCMLNCDSVNSGVFMRGPVGVSEMRIVVEGVAAPEPSSLFTVLIGTLTCRICSRRRTHRQLWYTGRLAT